jgi:DNA-3-methyladenine glycosylase II
LTTLNYTIARRALQQADPILGAVIDQVGDCRLNHSQQTGDLLFSVARSIIHQQLSTKAAESIHRRFLALYADLPEPTAAAILDTSDETLRAAGLSRAKVAYLKDLAQHILAGLPTLSALEAMTDAEIIQTLTQIKGVGRWTAQMLLIFRLHRWDVLPGDDLGVRTAVSKLYGLPELPDRKAVEHLGQPWQPYRSIATWYLWRSLEI